MKVAEFSNIRIVRGFLSPQANFLATPACFAKASAAAGRNYIYEHEWRE